MDKNQIQTNHKKEENVMKITLSENNLDQVIDTIGMFLATTQYHQNGIGIWRGKYGEPHETDLYSDSWHLVENHCTRYLVDPIPGKEWSEYIGAFIPAVELFPNEKAFASYDEDSHQDILPKTLRIGTDVELGDGFLTITSEQDDFTLFFTEYPESIYDRRSFVLGSNQSYYERSAHNVNDWRFNTIAVNYYSDSLTVVASMIESWFRAVANSGASVRMMDARGDLYTIDNATLKLMYCDASFVHTYQGNISAKTGAWYPRITIRDLHPICENYELETDSYIIISARYAERISVHDTLQILGSDPYEQDLAFEFTVISD
jgi:hypothetical protein